MEITSQKTTELRFIEQNHRTNLITGLFVTTQRNGIPPTHTPGQDDYSAVPLSDGQGLAYPNTILYDPTSHVLYLEINQIGVSEKRICEYFSAHANRLNIANFRLTLAPIHSMYLQPIITQYFIDNKSEIWLLFLIAHSKR